MFPRWYRLLRFGSVVAFGVMAGGITALRATTTPEPAINAAASRSGPPPTCRGWPLLVGHDRAGTPRRAYVRVSLGGKDVAFGLDTGSARSYVKFELDADPTVERRQTEVNVGGATRTLPGRRVLLDQDAYGAAERGDLPVSGTFGAEEVLQGTTDIDLRGGCLTRHPHGFALAETASWPEQPFIVVNGVIVTQPQLDGTLRPALFDTGVGYSILVSEDIQPYADHQVVHDVRGLVVDLFSRMGSVRWGDGPTEPVWIQRTPRFGTFDDMKLGDVHAMVGISAMGVRRIVVDPDRRVLLIGPR
jgi:hypothetical protein